VTAALNDDALPAAPSALEITILPGSWPNGQDLGQSFSVITVFKTPYVRQEN
jgi:hypothetical protein